MRSQTRLRRHLEPGWTVQIPGEGTVDHPISGNPMPAPPTVHEVWVSIQQRLLSGMTETGTMSVVDERVAVILPDDPADPPMEIPSTAVFFSPEGHRWNASGDGIVRRSAHRRPVYTTVSVRRAKEGDRG